jgi:glycerate dehydrogenase
MNKLKAVILESGTVSKGDISFEPLREIAGDLTEYDIKPDEQYPERVIELVGDSTIVFCNKTPFTAEVLEGFKNLKYIGICATGYNNVDMTAARNLGITVTNVPGYATAAVAETVFAFMLEFAKRTSDYAEFVDNGGWINAKNFAEFVFPMTELNNKTIGIIGYGTIGSAVGRIADAFGMRVLAFSRTPKTNVNAEFVSLERIFAESDYISVHCPLTAETEKLINAERLTLCKPTAIIINTSRGGVADEKALADALEKGIIAGAGLDVISVEPMRENSPLARFIKSEAGKCQKKLLITPHVAWAPIETRRRLMSVVEENLRQYLKGTPVNVVK